MALAVAMRLFLDPIPKSGVSDADRPDPRSQAEELAFQVETSRESDRTQR